MGGGLIFRFVMSVCMLGVSSGQLYDQQNYNFREKREEKEEEKKEKKEKEEEAYGQAEPGIMFYHL